MFQNLRIAAGHGSVFSTNHSDTLFSAGRNNFGQLGRSGDPSFASAVSTPPIKGISAGATHGLALAQNGNVMMWGSDQYGQVPAGGNLFEEASLGTVVQVEAGAYSSFVITQSNQLWARGRNNFGQLGLGDFNDRFNWEQVTGLPAGGNIQDVSAGIDHTLVLVDGVIFGFGSNGFHQLANPNPANVAVTPGVIDNTRFWIDVEAGGFHSLAVSNTNQVYSCGKNIDGQLGLGHTSPINTPTVVPSLNNVKAISAGYAHSLFLTDDGSNRMCFGTGSNRLGQISQPLGTPPVLTPQQIDTYIDVNEICAGPYTSLLIRADSWVKIWGLLANGQVSDSLLVFLTL